MTVFTRLLIGLIALFVSSTTIAEPIVSDRVAGRTDSCDVRSSVPALEVRCPTASVADLLAILHRSTGLRSEYPQELASTRVSVNLSRASLLQVLESAFSAFNFAVWIDQDAPSITWLRIVDLRGGLERPQQQKTYEQMEHSYPAASSTSSTPSTLSTPSTSSGSLVPENNEADMAWERERFSYSVTTTYPLEPGPVQESGMLAPLTKTLGTESSPTDSQ